MEILATVNGFEIVNSKTLNGWFTTNCGTISGESLEEVISDAKEYYKHLSVKARKGAKVYKFGVYAGFVLLSQYKTEEEAYNALFEKEDFFKYQAEQPSVRASQIKRFI